MKKIVLLLSLIFPAFSLLAQSESKNDTLVVKKSITMPEFPGGDIAMTEFIKQFIQIPTIKEPLKNTRVFVEFIVQEDGRVTNATVVRSPHELLSKEALRIINMFPNFKPAMQDGKPVLVKLTIPIFFDI